MCFNYSYATIAMSSSSFPAVGTGAAASSVLLQAVQTSCAGTEAPPCDLSCLLISTQWPLPDLFQHVSAFQALRVLGWDTVLQT